MSRSRTLAIAMSLLMVLSVVSATVSVAQPGPTEPTVEAASAATAQQVTAGGNVSRVAFDYGQFGGNLNIEVNGDRIYNISEFDAAPPDGIDGATIGGASVTVTSSGSTGHVEITGEISSFSVGGQEMYLDNVEFGPAGNPNATVTFRNLSPFQSSYAVGDAFTANNVSMAIEPFTFSDGTTYQQGEGRWTNGTNAGGSLPEFYPGNVNLWFNVTSAATAGAGTGDGANGTNVFTGLHRPQIDGHLYGHGEEAPPEGSAPEWADGYNATKTLTAVEGENVRGRVFVKTVGQDLFTGWMGSVGDVRRVRLRLDRDGDGELDAGDARLTATRGSESTVDADRTSYFSFSRVEVFRNGEFVTIDTERRLARFGVLAADAGGSATGIEARIDRGVLDEALGDVDSEGRVGVDVEIETESNGYDLGGDNGYSLEGTHIGNGWIDEIPEPETTTVDLGFDHLEVTQAVQTEDNDLPVVRGKETLARAFVTHNRSDALDVRVTFEAFSLDSGVRSIGTRTVTFEAPPGTPDRDDLDDSGNLELPASWTSHESVLLTAKVEPSNALVEDTTRGFLEDLGLESLDFEETYDPNVYVVRINEGPASAPEKPAWTRLFAMTDEFEATFPVADPNFVYLGSGALGPQSGQEDINLLGELIKLKAAIARGDRFSSKPTPDVLVGATDDPRSDGTIGLAAVAYPNGRSGTVASWANDPGSFVHEVNHNIGNDTWGRHVADASEGYGCNADDPDGLWNQRFDDDSIHALGWEPGEGLKLPESFGRTRTHDFMSYCGPAWVSDYRWKMLLDRFQNFTPGETIHPDLQSGSGSSSPSASVSNRTMRLISGTLHRNGTATLDPSFRLPGNATRQTVDEFERPQASLVVEYAETTITRPVQVNFNRSAHGEDTRPESLPFAITLPERSGIERIRLIDARTEERLDERVATDFEIESYEIGVPNEFGRNASTEVGISLETTTDRTLHRQVLYVPEGEELEDPLATDRYALPMGTASTEGSITATFEGLPGAQAGRFVVLVSDGVRTRIAVSQSFEVPPAPPRVRIDGSRSYDVTYDREAGEPGNRPLEDIERVNGEIRTTAGGVVAVDAAGADQFGRPLAGRETAEGEPTLRWELRDSQGEVVATDTGSRFAGSSGAIGEYVLQVTATDPTTGLTATDSVPVIVGTPPLPDRNELRTFRTAVAAATDDGDGTGLRVALRPTTRSTAAGANVTYDLVADPATDAVGSYDVNVTTSNASVGRFAAASDTLGGSLSDVRVRDNGTRVRFKVVGTSSGTGNVTLGTVTVRGVAPGNATLSLADVLVGDRNDSQYAIDIVEGATLTVRSAPTAPDVSGDGNPATDPDGDGRYEDVTGDGRANVIDVSVLLGAFDKPVVQNNVALFDYNGDDEVNILDVATLLGQV